MRSRTVESFFVALVLMPLVLVPGARAAEKQQTIIIALDQSGSMLRSDPDKLRVEAAGLLAATENPQDQVGVLAFGDSSHWLQQPVERDRFDFSLLQKVGASDAHTAFAPVLQAVEAYLIRQPSSYFQDHNVSLVLLTDGRSQPPANAEDGGKAADADRAQALSIAANNAWRLKIYTIGLGKDPDPDFLDRLARTANGFSIQAVSAADLPDAFLRIAARAAALPVYVRSASAGDLTWAGTPQRVVVVFTGEHAASLRAPGNVLYRSAHVAVTEENPSAGRAKADWSGKGLAFLCVQEPLSLSPEGDFPVALLTDAPHPLTLTLESRHGPIQNAFFLQSASAHVELAGGERQTVPLSRVDGASRFTGELEAQGAGNFRASAYLESPYGEVNTYLGNLTAYVAPVAIPEQVSAGVFDPLPRRWFGDKLQIRSLLPIGTVRVQFSPGASPIEMPSSLRLLPGHNPTVQMILGGNTGSIHVVKYSATWSDGETTVTRHGAMRFFVHQMTFAELIRNKLPWAAAALMLLIALAGAVWMFWPRPLQADLIVRRNGTQVLRLRLPSQMRTRTLQVSEGEVGNNSEPSRAVIAGSQSRELLLLESIRRGGR